MFQIQYIHDYCQENNFQPFDQTSLSPLIIVNEYLISICQDKQRTKLNID